MHLESWWDDVLPVVVASTTWKIANKASYSEWDFFSFAIDLVYPRFPSSGSFLGLRPHD